jgi:hypothetical protein
MARTESIPRPLNVFRSHAHASASGLPQLLYVGIELEPLAKKPTFCIYVHDGYFGMDYTIQDIPRDGIDIQEENESDSDINNFFESNLRLMEDQVIKWLRDYSESHNGRIVAAGVGLSYGLENLCRKEGEVFLCRRVGIVSKLKLPARLWAELDILPVLIETTGSSADERACAAVQQALPLIVQGSIGSVSRITIGFRHRVNVDGDGRIHLVDLDDYDHITPRYVIQHMKSLASTFTQKGTKVSFFNSTPQGGGVATMRHALMRLFRLLNVDFRWFVARPKPEVFGNKLSETKKGLTIQ